MAVLQPAGTCFWVLDEKTQSAEMIPLLQKLRPRRLMTNPYGRDVLQAHIRAPYAMIKQQDQ